MQQFNFPTLIFYGEGSLKKACKRIKELGFRKPLLVTDKTLSQIGLVDQVLNPLQKEGLDVIVFDNTHPNPIEEDCKQGAQTYKENHCDSLIALGGGSPMDAAKGIMVLATHEGPLEKYDDAQGGDRYITKPLPPLVAIPTTAGTGSEVGRAGVIIIEKTNTKTIIFHPTMMPQLAVLEPTLTVGLPPHITAATGIDAFVHCLEAYFSTGFHPMADGIALEGIALILDQLQTAYRDGKNLEARSKMLLAASMGATAFQKGLGMIHSIAHPLSSECGLHHGLANALALPECIKFLENSSLNKDQKKRLQKIKSLFKERALEKPSLSETCQSYFESLGVSFGLKNHGVHKDQVDLLAKKSYDDICHQTNMIPVTLNDFQSIIKASL